MSERLTPESPAAANVFPSPNHGERKDGRRPDMLILHYTGMPDGGEALQWLASPVSTVSAHYFVFEDGRVVQLVPEGRRAWHAGASWWGGERDINSSSIGVEIANAGHPGGLPPFGEMQIRAVIALCRDLVGRWRIAPDRILAHSDVAPGRKLDPGEIFPWERLHASGIGHGVRPAPVSDGRFLTYEFDPPTGDRFKVNLDARTSPDQNGSWETYEVRLLDADDAVVAAVRFRMVVVP